MKNFTIHIFGYGETQINSDEFSVKVKTTNLTKVQPLVTDIWSKKPTDSDAEQNYHAINIFNHSDIRYMSKKGFSIKGEDAADLKTKIDELIDELRTAHANLQNN
jgi:hypothetical protein